jgi:signal peptidase I
MRSKDIASYVVVILLISFALISRVFPMPFNISIVSGSSMLPTLRTGDIVVGISTYLSKFNVNDTVICCFTFSHCIIHRVVNFTATYVVTKGDNNPLPDPQVPLKFAKYKVVFVVPFVAWFLPVLFAVSFYLYLKRKEVKAFLISFTEVEFVVFAVFLLMDLSFVSLVPVNYFGFATIEKPSVELKGIWLVNRGKVLSINYSLSDVNLANVSQCVAYIFNSSFSCSTNISDSSLLVTIPSEVYLKAYEFGVERINVSLKVILDKGFLIGNYSYVVNWRPLVLSEYAQNVTVFNPNYIPMHTSNMTITYMGYDPIFKIPIVIETRVLPPILVEPISNFTIHVSPAKGSSYAYVEFTYKLRGRDIFERRKVSFG